MTKDFATRGGAAKTAQRKPRTSSSGRGRATPTRGKKKSPTFHGPSFSSGAIFGAFVVLLAAYLPEWMATESGDIAPTAAASSDTPKVTFEFPDLLKNGEIKVNTAPYQPSNPVEESEPASYRVQAASFLNEGDANEMRARLILLNLPAAVEINNSTTGTWHRVILGPFERRVDANRALTKLREQGISGIILN